MNCRTGWNREFIDKNLTKTFRSGPWRDHKKQLLINREKAILPNFQRYASAMLKMKEIKPLMTTALDELTKIQNEKYKLDSLIASYNGLVTRAITKEKQNEYIELHKQSVHLLPDIMISHFEKTRIHEKYRRSFWRYNDIYEDRDPNKIVEKKEFIMKCVKDGCRGFLSQAYKCELCSTYVCKDCMIVKNEKNDDNHVCKKDDVDSVALIRKDTRPCPKCGIRISKIDGCDQMWCTAEGCGTAFSWISNKIISGVVHNPHYYEWLRRNNNGVAPRPAGEILCGGLPPFTAIYRNLSTIQMSVLFPKVYGSITYIHILLSDIEHVRLAQYNIVRDANMFKELHVDFLINKIDEAAWATGMLLKENSLEKKQHIGLIIQTFFNAGVDMMRGLLTYITELHNKKIANNRYILNLEDIKPINIILDDFEKLKKYINESLVELGNVMLCAVPQFNNEWRYEAPRRLTSVAAVVAT